MNTNVQTQNLPPQLTGWYYQWYACNKMVTMFNNQFSKKMFNYPHIIGHKQANNANNLHNWWWDNNNAEKVFHDIHNINLQTISWPSATATCARGIHVTTSSTSYRKINININKSTAPTWPSRYTVCLSYGGYQFLDYHMYILTQISWDELIHIYTTV